MRPFTLIATITIVFLPTWLYADDEEDHGDERGRRGSPVSQLLPASAGLTQYQAECGACHLANPPGMLPVASWVRLLDGLADHFGENAELDPETRASLLSWLGKNAASLTYRLKEHNTVFNQVYDFYLTEGVEEVP